MLLPNKSDFRVLNMLNGSNKDLKLTKKKKKQLIKTNKCSKNGTSGSGKHKINQQWPYL